MLVTFSGESGGGDARVTELHEGGAFVQAVPGQQNVLATHKPMDELLILLQRETQTYYCIRNTQYFSKDISLSIFLEST